MSNSKGLRSYPAGPRENMEAYDSLPPRLRHALAYANDNWSAKQCADVISGAYSIDTGGDPELFLINHIAQKNAA